MSPQHWRGDPTRQSAASKWLRGRWPYGSLKVFDLDSVITSNDYRRGMLIEWKYVAASNRAWTFTQRLARQAGFYSALFVYDTDDGTPYGNVTAIQANAFDPNGSRTIGRPTGGEELRVEEFDSWILEQFGE